MINKEIIEKILSKVEDAESIELIDRQFDNGYYIFEFGDDSVCHFRVKGLRNWLFGVWCNETENTNEYKISLFGEHENYIDKFKPTRTDISYQFILDSNTIDNLINDDLYVSAIYQFSEQLSNIKKHPHIQEFVIYAPQDNFIRYHLSKFLYYNIKKPIKEFFEIKVAKWYLMFLKKWYIFRFKKSSNNFNVSIKDLGEGWLPRYQLYNYYDGIEDEDIDKIYWKIEKSWKRVPKFVKQNCSFEHYETAVIKGDFIFQKQKIKYHDKRRKNSGNGF